MTKSKCKNNDFLKDFQGFYLFIYFIPANKHKIFLRNNGICTHKAFTSKPAGHTQSRGQFLWDFTTHRLVQSVTGVIRLDLMIF